MKQLKFSEPCPELILEGKKCATWRINDEKDIKVGDGLSLCYNNGEEFAKAEVVLVKEKTFGEMTEEDKKGHEKFSSDEEMYKIYSKFYQFEVGPETKVKIIKFRLI